MAIPKIIHQVWEGRTEPCMPTRLQSWQELGEQNQIGEYHLWNGEEMDELVKTFSEYLSMYRSSHTMYNVGTRFAI